MLQECLEARNFDLLLTNDQPSIVETPAESDATHTSLRCSAYIFGLHAEQLDVVENQLH